jgi:hypothetical protein
MGAMDEITTGSGTIEMIRKKPDGTVEEYQIQGTQLINGDGVWCYQIPMNLDYMMTDEFGNMVPTNDPNKGIPTRTRVRFRVSMQDNEENVDNFFRAKVLVPHNPQYSKDGNPETYDYEFGSLTRDDSFRDLFWNNVYSVKSYIPRFQKSKVLGWKTEKFTGIKSCNFYGSNNPIPYNNMRIKLPFMFTMTCSLIKTFIFVVGVINYITSIIGRVLAFIGSIKIVNKFYFKKLYEFATTLTLNVMQEGLCPDLENWYFAPVFNKKKFKWVYDDDEIPKDCENYNLLKQTFNAIHESDSKNDVQSIDYKNPEKENNDGTVCLTIHTDYLISCIEMNLALEYRVIKFDFYNDWINGTI